MFKEISLEGVNINNCKPQACRYIIQAIHAQKNLKIT